jgi:hypothetical protein
MVKSVVIQVKSTKLESDTNWATSSWPKLSRPSTSSLQLAAKKGVDARVICAKTRFALLPGHNVERAKLRRRTTRKPRRHFFVLPESFTASKVANSTL